MARKAKILPDVDELKRMFYIDSSIPEGLRWRIKPSKKVCKDSPAGTKNNLGYFITTINRNIYRNHRIIYSIYHNINLSSEQIVDHLDRCPQNNHPSNLRIVTHIENNRNRTKRKNTSSKYKGVYFFKRDKKYSSVICVNKKITHLGYFSSEQEAAKAYNSYIISHNLSHFNLNDL